MAIGTRFSGTEISWRMIISIGTGVLKGKQTTLIHCQNFGEMLYWLIFGQEAFWNPWIVLNVNETRVKWNRRNNFYQKKNLHFRSLSQKLIISIGVPSELIITYISAGKCTFNIKDTKNVPVKGIDSKHQRQPHLQNM